MALTGGLRYRMMAESIYRDVEAFLTAEGWFDAGRYHRPITMVDEYPEEGTEVAVNTLAVSMGDSFTQPTELGSQAESMSVPFFCDFFGENDALGRHIIGDIYEHVQKKKVFDILDYQQATPPVDFQVSVVEQASEIRKPERATNPWQKHWYVAAFLVEDERSNA